MEGVPRMPMIPVEMKTSPMVAEFGERIKEYISHNYQESGDSYAREIYELEKLRDAAVHAVPDFTSCATLKKYYAQLLMVRSRFPMASGEACTVQFVWHDKYGDVLSPGVFDDVGFEMACIMHNIGAIHANMGTANSRLDSEGMKVACTHFQCAAWAFQQLRDNLSAAQYSIDFDANLLSWYNSLMLAQAQECILEKSLIDNRKHNIIAKVAMQVVEFYKQCVKILEHPTVQEIAGSTKIKSWVRFIEMKAKYYLAIVYYCLGNQAEEAQAMGERLAYFQAANNVLQEARKLCAKQDFDTADQMLTFTNDVIVGKFNIAKKENDFIYHDRIPALETLPEIKGAALVKGIGFDPMDPEISGPDIFARLVPLAVHQAASLYSEEKAKLFREVVTSVEARNEELTQYLSALQVDKLLLEPPGQAASFPQQLLERCAMLNARPNEVSDISAFVKSLVTQSEDVKAKLDNLSQTVEHELKELEDMKVSFGAQEGLDAAISTLKDLKPDLAHYESVLNKATTANVDLNNILSVQFDLLKELSQPLSELQKNLPPFPVDGASTPEGAELKRILAKVEEMRAQREALLSQLRSQIMNDDITKRLIASQDKEPDEVFQLELKKHEKQTKIIEQNLAAQANILEAFTQANAKYVDVRKRLQQTLELRENKIDALFESFDSLVTIKEKAARGHEFFVGLVEALNGLNAKLDTVLSQKNAILQRLQEENAKRAKAAEASKAALEATVAGIRASSIPSSTSKPEDPQSGGGPKLKDYLAYYKARKAGQNVAFPGAGEFSAVPEPTPSATALPQQTYVNSQNGNYHPESNSSQESKPPSSGGTVNFSPAEFAAAMARSQQYLEAYNRGTSISTVPPTPGVGAYSQAGPNQTAYSASATYQQSQSAVHATYQPPPQPNMQQLSMQPNSMVSASMMQYNAAASTIPSVSGSFYSLPTNASASGQFVGGPSASQQQMQPSIGVPHQNSLGQNVAQSFYATPQQNVAPSSFGPTAVNYSVTGAAGFPATPQSYYGVSPAANTVVHSSLPSSQTRVSTMPPPSTGLMPAQGGNQYVPQQPTGGYQTPALSSAGVQMYNNVMTSHHQAGQASTFQNSNAQPVGFAGGVRPNPAIQQQPQQNYGQTYSSNIQVAQQQLPASVAASYPQQSLSAPGTTPSAGTGYNYSTTQSATAVNQQQGYLPGVTHTNSSAYNAQAQQYQQVPRQQMATPTPPSASYPQGYVASGVGSGQMQPIMSHANVASNPANMQANYANATNVQIGGVPSVNHQSYAQQGQTVGYYHPPNAVAVSGVSAYPSTQPQPSVVPLVTNSPNNILDAVNHFQSSQLATPAANLPPPLTPGSASLSKPAPSAVVVNSKALQDDLAGLNISAPPPVQPAPSKPSQQQLPKLEPAAVVGQPKTSTLPPTTLIGGGERKSSLDSVRATTGFHKPMVALAGGAHTLVDALADDQTLSKFHAEVQRLEKYVEGLNRKSLNGPTALETKWKELCAKQEVEAKKHSISVARCSASKNRFPDIMPYDDTRVVLKQAKDDYINASRIAALNEWSPTFIATQLPTKSQEADFWQMVLEQNVEIIVALISDLEMKGKPYWPEDRKEPLLLGALTISLQSVKQNEFWTERIITLSQNDRQIKSVVHVQYSSWPIGDVPAQSKPLLKAITDVLGYYKQQRVSSHPVCVHCISGVSRTAVFCLLCSAMQEIRSAGTLPQLAALLEQIRQYRKYMIYEPKELLFTYEALLCHCRDLLMKRGILTNTQLTSASAIANSTNVSRTHSRNTSQDFVIEKGSSICATPSLKAVTASASAEVPHHVVTSDRRGSHSSVSSIGSGSFSATPINNPEERTDATAVLSPGSSRKTDGFGSPSKTTPDAADVSRMRQADKSNNNGYTPCLSGVVHHSQQNNSVSNHSKPESDNTSECSNGHIKNGIGGGTVECLSDLTDPSKFYLDASSGKPTKKKITKADFLDNKGSLDIRETDSNDPFSFLDPMWSLKK